MRRSDAYRKHCVRNDELMAFQSHNLFLTQLGFVLTAARMASISSFPKNGFSMTGIPATDAWRATAGVTCPLIKSAGTLTPWDRSAVTSSSPVIRGIFWSRTKH